MRRPFRASEGRFHARHPCWDPHVRQKVGFTHGIPPESLPCARSPVPRTASRRSPFCASKALFHARYPCRRPSCASEAPFHARHPCWDPPVRQKPRSTHGIPAESLLCVKSPVSRTTSRRSPSRASKALFHARYPCRSPSCASEGRFHARHPAGVPSVRQKVGSTHGIPAGDLPCARSPVPRTASLPETFRAPEAPFYARRLSTEIDFRRAAGGYSKKVFLFFSLRTCFFSLFTFIVHIIAALMFN